MLATEKAFSLLNPSLMVVMEKPPAATILALLQETWRDGGGLLPPLRQPRSIMQGSAANTRLFLPLQPPSRAGGWNVDPLRHLVSFRVQCSLKAAKGVKSFQQLILFKRTKGKKISSESIFL
ncbi:hypothetical protein NN561_017737 [Cricetulus griseus]